MNVRLTISLLLGVSLCLSAGALAVSENRGGDYLNWSYAMGESADPETKAKATATTKLATKPTEAQPTCTEGCNTCSDPVETLDFIFEDEAPLAAELTTFPEDLFDQPLFVSVKDKKAGINTTNNIRFEIDPALLGNSQLPFVNNPVYQGMGQSPYPVTVHRNVTIDQPMITQQPVVVQRPVVVQQDVVVHRQPKVTQVPPLVVPQQPTYVQPAPLNIQYPVQDNTAFAPYTAPYPMPVYWQPVGLMPIVGIPVMGMPMMGMPFMGMPTPYPMPGQMQPYSYTGQPMMQPLSSTSMY